MSIKIRPDNGPRNINYITRRGFIKIIGIGGGLALFGQFGIRSFSLADSKVSALKMILVDYNRCTGCRTCEAICSAYNNLVTIDGERLPGLGNPSYSNIHIVSFNPDVDIPNVCMMCGDTPCVKACPVTPDLKTGRRALYRDDKTLTVQNDPERCIGCGSCVMACSEQRAGVIELDAKTGKPRGICTLCGGDPKCVKFCPFGALSYVEAKIDRKFYGLPPYKIASELIKSWYGISK